MISSLKIEEAILVARFFVGMTVSVLGSVMM